MGHAPLESTAWFWLRLLYSLYSLGSKRARLKRETGMWVMELLGVTERMWGRSFEGSEGRG